MYGKRSRPPAQTREKVMPQKIHKNQDLAKRCTISECILAHPERLHPVCEAFEKPIFSGFQSRSTP